MQPAMYLDFICLKFVSLPLFYQCLGSIRNITRTDAAYPMYIMLFGVGYIHFINVYLFVLISLDDNKSVPF